MAKKSISDPGVIWNSQKRMMERYFYAITRRKTKIYDIKGEDAVGYTTEKGDIHLAVDHPVMSSLSEEEKPVLRFGVFAHELLHQVLTDFAYCRERAAGIEDRKLRTASHTFFNLVEDAAIEYRASGVFGGLMLKSLEFTIRHFFEAGLPLEESGSPFGELHNALVMLGDLGIIKGHFTSERAFRAFEKIAPEFHEYVLSGESRDRMDIAVKWAEETRDLWDDPNDTDEDTKNKMDAMSRGIGQTEPECSSSPQMSADDAKPDSESETEKRRKELVEKLEEDGSNGTESQDTSDTGGDGAGSEGEMNGGRNDEPDTKGSGSETNDGGLRSGASDDTRDSGNEGGDPSDKKPSSSGDDGIQKEGRAKAGSDPSWQDRANEVTTDAMEADDIAEEDYSFSSDDLQDLVRSVMHEIEAEAEKEDREERQAAEVPDFIPKAMDKGGIRVLNQKMVPDDAFAGVYQTILAKHGKEISSLTKCLKRILETDAEETVWASGGRYNLMRGTIGTTAKIFDRRKDPAGITDTAVVLLIDESGSMYGKKEAAARESAVILAEAFANLSIACQVIGFTADMRTESGDKDVIHHHYVSWKNTKKERTSLAAISAYANNFDGYSIRYAAEILKRYRAEHKILFVISDGLPACLHYRSREEGLSDTAAAIVEAGRYASVFGVGIGVDGKQEQFRKMYRGNFVYVQHADGLANTMASQLKRTFRSLKR